MANRLLQQAKELSRGLIVLLRFREQICSLLWSRALSSDRSRHVGGGRAKRRPGHDRRAATPADDLKAQMSIEQAPPGSALDDQLRREQAKAIFDLLIAHRRGHPD